MAELDNLRLLLLAEDAERYGVLERMPFMHDLEDTVVICGVRPLEDEFVYNPEVFAKLSHAQAVYILRFIAEIANDETLMDKGRAVAAFGQAGNDFEGRIWNVAVNYYVNQKLADEGFRMPGMIPPLEGEGLFDETDAGRSFQEIMERVLTDARNQESEPEVEPEARLLTADDRDRIRQDLVNAFEEAKHPDAPLVRNLVADFQAEERERRVMKDTGKIFVRFDDHLDASVEAERLRPLGLEFERAHPVAKNAALFAPVVTEIVTAETMHAVARLDGVANVERHVLYERVKKEDEPA